MLFIVFPCFFPGSQLLAMQSLHRFRSRSFMGSTKSSGGNCRGVGEQKNAEAWRQHVQEISFITFMDLSLGLPAAKFSQQKPLEVTWFSEAGPWSSRECRCYEHGLLDIYIYMYNIPCFWCWFGCLLHLTTRLGWSGQLMSAHSAAVRCNFEHLSVAMLHAKKNHLLDDEELMRLDTCRELHGRSSPRFIDLAPFQGSGSGRGWFCMHGFLGRIRQCSSSISDTQIFIYRYPDLLLI